MKCRLAEYGGNNFISCNWEGSAFCCNTGVKRGFSVHPSLRTVRQNSPENLQDFSAIHPLLFQLVWCHRTLWRVILDYLKLVEKNGQGFRCIIPPTWSFSVAISAVPPCASFLWVWPVRYPANGYRFLQRLHSWNTALTAEYPAAVAAAGQDPAVLAELLSGEKIFRRKIPGEVSGTQ